MTKYTSEEKLLSARRYLDGKERLREVVKLIGTGHKEILKWPKQYQKQWCRGLCKTIYKLFRTV